MLDSVVSRAAACVLQAEAIIANPVSYAHFHCADRLKVPLHLYFPFPWTPTKVGSAAFQNNWTWARPGLGTSKVITFLTQALGERWHRFQGCWDFIKVFVMADTIVFGDASTGLVQLVL